MMVVEEQSSRHNMWTEITRRKYEREGQRYATDLMDAEWALIEAHMPAVKRLGRPRETALRNINFARESDIERKWREIRLYQTAPISTNLILAYIGQHVLGMPRSYLPPPAYGLTQTTAQGGDRGSTA